MPSIAYVNGRYGPIEQAAISVEDRGFQFADGVYEVTAVLNGRLLDWDRHLWRLRRNLAALFIDMPQSDAVLGLIAARLIRKSRHDDGILYVQVTRGVAPRNHGFPQQARPTLVMTIRPFDFQQQLHLLNQGVAVMTLPDERHQRRDIKGTSLLPAVLAKQEAREAGAYEAIFLRDGVVTEGSSTNAYLVDAEGRVITHPLARDILPGLSRQALLEEAVIAGIHVIERPFTEAELHDGAELFLTSTTAPLLPVTMVDGRQVGDGTPGPQSRRLGVLVWDRIRQQTGWRY